MLNRPRLRGVLHVLALALAWLPKAASAADARLVAADDRGVTVRVDVPRWTLAPGADGRFELRVPGYAVASDSGRPLLPFANVLVALPQGATARARVIAADPESTIAGVRLTLQGRPVMRDTHGPLGLQPDWEPVAPVLDGPWPRGAVRVGAPVTLRRQRMVAVRIDPFRYDEATARLWAHRSLTVRIDFVGGAASQGGGGEDRFFEPVVKNLVVNPEQATRFRAFESRLGPRRIAAGGRLLPGALPAATARRAAFDESEPEVRVKIDTTGVYGLDYDRLAAAGYPAAVPVGEVSVHRHEFVPDATPSYVTIELPIEVDDANSNGTFDSGDRILVWVQNWAERSRASLESREWGNAEVVYATRLRGGAGLRMTTRPALQGYTGLTPLASYPWTQKFEHTFGYLAATFDTTWLDRFSWTADPYMFYYSRPDSFPYETNDLDTTRTAQFRTRWEGNYFDAHFLWATTTRRARTPNAVPTYVADSALFVGVAPYIATATIPGSALSEGLTNRFSQWGRSTSGAPNPNTTEIVKVALDWFEVTYWRRYKALRGYLSCNSGDAAGPFQIHATGFTFNQMEVWDVSDSTAPVRLVNPQIGGAGSSWTVDFQDSAGISPKRYVVWEIPKSPPDEAITPVTRLQLSDSSVPYDYLLIVPEAFQVAASPLKALRDAQGVRARLATLEAVNDEFNGGRKSKFAIKRFVRFAYNNWASRFVLLVGDGSQDGRNLLPWSGKDWVPIAPINSNVQSELIAGDPWYGWCLDDDPACPNDPTPIPQLYVGRLPASTVQEVTDEVAKIVRYEDLSGDQLWRRRMLLLSDDAYSGTIGGDLSGGAGYCFRPQEISFRTLNHEVRAAIIDPDQGGLAQCQVDTLDVRSFLTNPALYQANGSDTCRVGQPTGLEAATNAARATVTPRLIGQLSAGVLWWNYQGHANQYILGHEGFFVNGGAYTSFDYQDIANTDMPFLFSAFSCHANDFANYQERFFQNGRVIGENLMNHPRRSAVASWASAGYELVPNSYYYHLNVEQSRAMFSDPPRDPDLGDRGARVVLGEALELAVARYVTAINGNFLEKFVGLTYNLLGDPATRFSVGPPQIFVTANGESVVDNQPVRLASVGDSLRLEADVVSNVKLNSVTVLRVDGAGTHSVPPTDYLITPALGDTSTNQRRYHVSFVTLLGSDTRRFIITSTDRYGLTTTFNIVFELETVLYYHQRPVANGDVLPPDASGGSPPGLTLLLRSPSTVQPLTDLELRVDSVVTPFVATPVDSTQRNFLLSWTHGPYSPGRHVITLYLNGTLIATHTFVVGSELAIQNLITFPNPFDDSGMRFSFYLEGATTGNVLVRVFTPSGHMIWEHQEPVEAGHDVQIPWDARDRDNDTIANGVYFYRLTVRAGGATVTRQGPIVKLRKPHRVEDTAATP